MASMKMCKPANETGHCGTNQAMVATTQSRPCGPCGGNGAHAPEKKHHFWHRQHNEQSHGQAAQAGHGNKLTQCFGAAYGVKPHHAAGPGPHHGAGPHHGYGHGGAYGCNESNKMEVTRFEKKEERVKIVQFKKKSCVVKGNECKYSDSSSDSESDNEGKGRRRMKC